MSFLKQVTVAPVADEIQLEKPRHAVILNGDTKAVSEVLASVKAEHDKRGSDEGFSALVLVLPLFEGMPSLDVTRERKLKDDKGNATGEVEEYLSARKYADSSTFALPGLAITEGWTLKAGIRFFEAPRKSAATVENNEDEAPGEAAEDE